MHVFERTLPLLCASLAFASILGCSCSKKAKTARANPSATVLAAASVSPVETTSCPEFRSGRKLGRIANSDLKEASGLAVSRRNPEVLWSHNDHGGEPRVFAMTLSGQDLGEYHLAKAKLEDWEDLAIGPAETPGDFYVYVGDTGTNNKPRHRVSIYRFLEPEVSLKQPPKKRKIRDVVRFDLTYPDGKVHDCETLMVDPWNQDLYLVTKPRDDIPKIYRARADRKPFETQVLEEVAKLSVFERGSKRSTLVTAGDISPDGSQIVIRTYTTAYLWLRRTGEGIGEAVEREPCQVPLSHEPQGETIAFTPDGRGYYTVSEGEETKILFFERKP